MESKVQLKEEKWEGRWQKWVEGEEDTVRIEEGVDGAREEMVREVDKRGMEGGQILQAESGHHRAMDWALNHWKTSLEKTRL